MKNKHLSAQLRFALFNAADEYMNEVLQGGGGLNSFEAEHAISAIYRDSRIPAATQAVIANKLQIQNGSIANSNVHQAVGNGQYMGGNMSTVRGQVAEMSIITQRNSSNIRTPLPVALFMSDYVSNNYLTILSNFIASLSPGTTLASVVTNPTYVRFTFVNGASTDTVDIYCDTSPYPSFLSSLNTTWFKTVMLKMELNNLTSSDRTDGDAARQFKVAITPYYDTSFGAFGGNRSPLSGCKAPNQYQKNIIDIPWAKYPISPREGWVLPVIHAGTASDVISLNISHPVQELTRTSAGK